MNEALSTKIIAIDPVTVDQHPESEEFKIFTALLKTLQERPEQITENIKNKDKIISKPLTACKLKRRDSKRYLQRVISYSFEYNGELVHVTLDQPIKQFELATSQNIFCVIEEGAVGKGASGSIKSSKKQYYFDNQLQVNGNLQLCTSHEQLAIKTVDGAKQLEIDAQRAYFGKEHTGFSAHSSSAFKKGTNELIGYKEDILMPKIEGMTLKKMLENGFIQGLTYLQCLTLMQNIAKALQEFYQKTGLEAHGDLKPDNMIINPKTLSVTLIDFGSVEKEEKNKDSKWHGTVRYRMTLSTALAAGRLGGGDFKDIDRHALAVIFAEVLHGHQKKNESAAKQTEAENKRVQFLTELEQRGGGQNTFPHGSVLQKYCDVISCGANSSRYQKPLQLIKGLEVTEKTYQQDAKKFDCVQVENELSNLIEAEKEKCNLVFNFLESLSCIHWADMTPGHMIELSSFLRNLAQADDYHSTGFEEMLQNFIRKKDISEEQQQTLMVNLLFLRERLSHTDTIENRKHLSPDETQRINDLRFYLLDTDDNANKIDVLHLLLGAAVATVDISQKTVRKIKESLVPTAVTEDLALPESGQTRYVFFDSMGTKYWYDDRETAFYHAEYCLKKAINIEQQEAVANLNRSSFSYGKTTVTASFKQEYVAQAYVYEVTAEDGVAEVNKRHQLSLNGKVGKKGIYFAETQRVEQDLRLEAIKIIDQYIEGLDKKLKGRVIWGKDNLKSKREAMLELREQLKASISNNDTGAHDNQTTEQVIDNWKNIHQADIENHHISFFNDIKAVAERVGIGKGILKTSAEKAVEKVEKAIAKETGDAAPAA